MPPLDLESQIRIKYQMQRCYHMTHIQNLSSIFKDNELKSYNKMQLPSANYKNLANNDVQAGRATISIPCTGKPLHDYVPLYLGFKTPMAAVNQNHNEDFVFLHFSLNILTLGNMILSDGNARSHRTQFRLYTQIGDLDFLDFQAIKTVKYAHDDEVKRKKQSEVLVFEKLSLSHLVYITCYSEVAKTRVLAEMQKSAITSSVTINPSWYFKSKD